MVQLSGAFFAVAAVSLVSAQHDGSAKLTKPPLVQNLDYLKPGFAKSLPHMDFTKDQWKAGWIPQECKHIIEGNVEKDVKYKAEDIQTWNIHYKDCGDAWVFCHHKDSPISIDSMASQFGRLPVQMREYVKHVIDVPAKASWAFEWDGTVTFINPTDDFLSVIIHETGHSLDLNKAYADKPLSTSDNWWNNYNADKNVPDNYAQTNLVEDVAQNTVLAVYNENVKGGYGGLEPKSQNVFHQMATIITEARNAGKGNSIIVPGENQKCAHRIAPSQAVPVNSASSKRWDIRIRGEQPDTSLKSGVEEIVTNRTQKHSGCSLTW